MSRKKRSTQINSETADGMVDGNKSPADDETQRDSAGRQAYEQASPIFEAGNRYCSNTSSGGSKQITNFVMRPVNAIQGDSVYLLDIEFTLNSGTKFTQQLNSAAFASVPKFKAELKRIGGLDMTFDGTESDLSHIQNYMNNKYREYNRCKGVSYVGMYKLDGEWVYVGTDGAIDKKGNPITNLVSILEDNDALNSGIIGTKLISGNELIEISENLFRFNTYERTIAIIGWVCACFLKERLRHRQTKMSHLVLAGAAGSGKSETLEKIIQPIFSLTGSGIGCKGLTNFSTLKSTSSTNLLPIIYEEYKPHKLSPAELNIISGLLRNTYDYQSSQRGRVDQSVVNYVRRSPIIVVGESSFDETAVKERIIDVQFAEGDRTETHTKCFKALAKKGEILNRLGKGLLLLAMNLPDNELDAMIEQSRVFDSLEFEPRVTLGISNVKLGILFLKALYGEYHLDFEELTGVTDNLVYDSLVSGTINAMDGSTKTRSAVDLIIQTFDKMALKNTAYENMYYLIDKSKKQLCLRINLLYDEFTKYVRDHNITDIEVLACRQFTKQLRKEKYYVEYAQRTFKKDGDKEGERKKCYVLDLKMLNKICDLEAFSLEGDESELPEDKDGFIDAKAAMGQEELPFV